MDDDRFSRFVGTFETASKLREECVSRLESQQKKLEVNVSQAPSLIIQELALAACITQVASSRSVESS
jgi:hypothetical protein